MQGTWLAQSEEHVTLDLMIVSLSPTLVVEITKQRNTHINKQTKKKSHRCFSYISLQCVIITDDNSQGTDLPRPPIPETNGASTIKTGFRNLPMSKGARFYYKKTF